MGALSFSFPDRVKNFLAGVGAETEISFRLKKGRAAGVRTESAEVVLAPVVVSNADAKKTFLELCAPADNPPDWLDLLRSTPYPEAGLNHPALAFLL